MLDAIKTIMGLGGATVLGFVLKAWWDKRQGRVQPIRYRIETDRIFSQKHGLEMQIIATGDESGATYLNLTLLKLTLTNGSERDFDMFPFKLVMPEGYTAVSCERETPDPAHECNLDAVPTHSNHLAALDIHCVPFNRRDSYVVKIYATGETDTDALLTLTPCSVLPVKFVLDVPTDERRVLAAYSLGTSVGITVALLAAGLGYWKLQLEPRLAEAESNAMAMSQELREVRSQLDTVVASFMALSEDKDWTGPKFSKELFKINAAREKALHPEK